MTPLRWLANIFINTFGITQPTSEQENRMAAFIGGLLGLVLLGIVVAAIVLRASFHA